MDWNGAVWVQLLLGVCADTMQAICFHPEHICRRLLKDCAREIRAGVTFEWIAQVPTRSVSLSGPTALRTLKVQIPPAFRNLWSWFRRHASCTGPVSSIWRFARKHVIYFSYSWHGFRFGTVNGQTLIEDQVLVMFRSIYSV